ncbi:MAG: Macrolide export ATP-binding/permease protein MacB [candidate division WWE3 bacterium GW2011_GWA1_46_21]|uniref:Macrolide export ATP-binding/permease protein MacB n=4 Tax=Katanobacteria TaxID=422282 RepID=A0A0G1PDM1_UNCKA|nr:MAG: Macrolide export ATP-binding/permease protein MacB [candidate division WWE3 bacterium GW2011_GWA1_46_21]KKU48951.1 MAG: Macrolide export ATP-binding/permease protein MacB [candidate division WWE3 bacterium GW2011_GWA2_46_9]KKU51085.1 MAG: Macrolide export ATP-binding/permease protein MacB [candidate division WWE3 bacterium GW2011_GWC1_47_10]KKU57621.1 MAG: Macrolide export ATP-binding/permease protein MacB [candidate division WWE3 bacterium GW2011_GWB1_47_11]
MTPVLTVQTVCKTYMVGGEVIEALKDVSLEIGKGEFVSIVGKSGSGKSTLMHLMGLLDSPTFGTVVLNQKNTERMGEKELARIRNKEIGFVFQAFNLLGRANCLENVMLPLQYSDFRGDRATKALEILTLVGLQDRIRNKSNELSGGQKQRVAIARALVNDPSIILADEPTGNLDSKTGDEIIALLKQLNALGKTVVVVTHDPDLAKIANKIITISDGRIV